ncbi:hypothetical protein MMC34_008736, partial [Xylographa carneopallida]|nr:hypothetical protein [Xylographa carneopallida]
RGLASYCRHDLRILRLCLPADWNELDGETGQSPLPASLLALTIGYAHISSQHRSVVQLKRSVCGDRRQRGRRSSFKRGRGLKGFRCLLSSPFATASTPSQATLTLSTRSAVLLLQSLLPAMPSTGARVRHGVGLSQSYTAQDPSGVLSLFARVKWRAEEQGVHLLQEHCLECNAVASRTHTCSV